MISPTNVLSNDKMLGGHAVTDRSCSSSCHSSENMIGGRAVTDRSCSSSFLSSDKVGGHAVTDHSCSSSCLSSDNKIVNTPRLAVAAPTPVAPPCVSHKHRQNSRVLPLYPSVTSPRRSRRRLAHDWLFAAATRPAARRPSPFYYGLFVCAPRPPPLPAVRVPAPSQSTAATRSGQPPPIS